MNASQRGWRYLWRGLRVRADLRKRVVRLAVDHLRLVNAPHDIRLAGKAVVGVDGCLAERYVQVLR